MKKILPILLAIIGLAAGGGAGFVLRPVPEEPEVTAEEQTEKDAEVAETPEDPGDANRAFVKINNQFVIPIVKDDMVRALVVLSITLETLEADTEVLYNNEPKLRDAFISILFDYAYAGGFGEDFTSSPNLDRLRLALRESAQQVVPDRILNVLITDIVRQDA